MALILGRYLLKHGRNTGLNFLHKEIRHASTYKAAVLKSEDAPFEIEEMKRPKLKSATEVRIQVAYCSVNTFDVLDTDDKSFPHVPGYELSGEILEAGSNVPSDMKEGARVVALNFPTLGGLAEECIVDAKDVWTIPSDLSLKDAAVAAYGHSIALYTFGILSPIKENTNMVVSVGPAGLGLAAVDVAVSLYKAKVLAVTDTEKNSEIVRQKGAFQTMHYGEKVQKNIIKAFGDKRADIVYDAVGGNIRDIINSCVSDYGSIITPILGRSTVPPPHATLRGVSLKRLREQNCQCYRQVVQETLDLAHEGTFSPYLSEKFELKDINKAVEFIKGKQCTGKVVVRLN